jgi:hypothetical protein
MMFPLRPLCNGPTLGHRNEPVRIKTHRLRGRREVDLTPEA